MQGHGDLDDLEGQLQGDPEGQGDAAEELAGPYVGFIHKVNGPASLNENLVTSIDWIIDRLDS